MSRIDQLITRLCPEGIEFNKLGDFALLSNNGVDKKILPDESKVSLLNYLDVCRNAKITSENLTAITTASTKKIVECNLRKGDIFITPSSETRDELANAAEIISDIPNAVYSYHIMRIRFHDLDRINPTFIVHLFGSKLIQDQIITLSTGITRYGLTKPKWESLRFPTPPIEIQNEIVGILDKFKELEVELKAELEARKKQYSFYRFKLVDDNKSKTVKLKNATEATFWIMPSTPTYDESEGIAYITSKNLSKGNIEYKGSKRISQKSYNEITKNRPIKEDDLLIGMIGTIGEIARVKRSDLPIYGQNMYLVRFDQEQIDINYFLHYFDSELMKNYFNSVKNNSAQGYLKAEHIDEIQIPLPTLIKQKEIAKILDNYSALINDTATGLPAELIARRQQYEYFRNKLLTFKELEVA